MQCSKSRGIICILLSEVRMLCGTVDKKSFGRTERATGEWQ